jgi:hypothetical protein
MATIPLLGMIVALALEPPSPAVTLGRVDRSIGKEPAYQTGLPKYCLLVFGPEAKTRVWLVVDGNELYIDRNGNGDLTEAGECVAATLAGRWHDFPAGQIQETNGTSRQISLRIRDFNSAYGKCAGLMVILDGKRKQFVGFDEANPFQLAHRPQHAPVVHLEGPLRIKLYGEPPILAAGEETELNIAIGTPGVGPGSFCAIQCCTVLECKTSPVAEIEFPHRDPSHAPIRLRVPIADD